MFVSKLEAYNVTFVYKRKKIMNRIRSLLFRVRKNTTKIRKTKSFLLFSEFLCYIMFVGFKY